VWIKNEDGNYRNVDTGQLVQAVDMGGGVHKVVIGTTVNSTATVDGISEASQGDAQDVIRRLVHGVTATDIT
jgi:hypothetical protein